jgi:hypothetical protein
MRASLFFWFPPNINNNNCLPAVPYFDVHVFVSMSVEQTQDIRNCRVASCIAHTSQEASLSPGRSRDSLIQFKACLTTARPASVPRGHLPIFSLVRALRRDGHHEMFRFVSAVRRHGCEQGPRLTRCIEGRQGA